jgi:carbonic anhydrase
MNSKRPLSDADRSATPPTNEPLASSNQPGRRRFLQLATCGAMGAGLTSAGLIGSSPKAFAQGNLTPDSVMQELIDGNKRFATGKITSNDHDLEILKQHNAEKQEPIAAVLSCADSRVPVELVFDQTIGHIFVTRVAGNMVTPEIIASLEYGAAVLGTKVILVMGHAACGAVQATIQAKSVPGQISVLYQHLQPAVDQAGTDLEAAIKANAKIQAGLLSKTSTVIAELIKTGKVKVAAGYYDIVSGNLTIL